MTPRTNRATATWQIGAHWFGSLIFALGARGLILTLDTITSAFTNMPPHTHYSFKYSDTSILPDTHEHRQLMTAEDPSPSSVWVVPFWLKWLRLSSSIKILKKKITTCKSWQHFVINSEPTALYEAKQFLLYTDKRQGCKTRFQSTWYRRKTQEHKNY